MSSCTLGDDGEIVNKVTYNKNEFLSIAPEDNIGKVLIVKYRVCKASIFLYFHDMYSSTRGLEFLTDWNKYHPSGSESAPWLNQYLR